MMKKNKTVNLICIFLVMAVLMSSTLITAMALLGGSETSDPEESRPPFGQFRPNLGDIVSELDISLEDLSGLLNLNGMLGLSELVNPDVNLDVYRIKSTKTDKLYLRIKSFGDYNGSNTWGDATEYTKRIDSEHSAFYLPSWFLDQNNITPASLEIEPSMNQYILPYYPSSKDSENIQTSDIMCSGNGSKTYTVLYHSSKDVHEYMSTREHNNSYESEYAEYVRNEYLDIDPETLAYMQNIIKLNGFSASDPKIIDKVADYISHAAAYNMLYDRQLDKEPNVAIAFLEKYRTGICQHYATSATLLFRALGIPARYTVGFVAKTVADEWVSVTSQSAHAWVEVYVDGFGWMFVEVTGSLGGEVRPPATPAPSTPPATPPTTPPATPPVVTPPESTVETPEATTPEETPPETTPEITTEPETTPETPPETTEEPIKITIKPDDIVQQYKGQPVKVENRFTITGFDEWKEKGYKYNITVKGESDVMDFLGKQKLTVDSCVIFDPDGNKVSDDRLDVTLEEGTMHLYMHALKVRTSDGQQPYTGLPLKNPSAELVNDYLLNSSYGYDLEATGSQLNVGKSYNTFRITIYDENGTDITDQYLIKPTYGVLEVTPADITLKANDDEKHYDGSALTNPEYYIKEGALALGDKIDQCTVIGSQTEIGRSDNVIDPKSIVIVNALGEDVTSNYAIKLEVGILRVTP